ncbi:MAG: SAM-dependent methyltransferase [Gammaproteobacteria bacterium]
MDSKELGLVLARQLIGVEDLHYGLWDPDLELSFANIRTAQQRFNELLLSRLPQPAAGVRVLDVGCGTGHLLGLMLDRGYAADGVVPAAALARIVRERIESRPGSPARVFECRFEDLPDDRREAYDVVLFSESFQYVGLADALPRVQRLLRPGGMLLICDFFKTAAHGDGGPGDRSMGGGHPLAAFHEAMARAPFEPLEDLDITTRMSPNLKLLNDLLMQKVKPATLTVDRFLEDSYPKLYWLARKLMRRRLAKVERKYFSGLRSAETFERYKTYHLLRYRLKAA